ncbi:MAG: GTP-binding protein, partial [Clostridia bacterium]|nr:GTP-binding protein [Clostridia bacterium]
MTTIDIISGFLGAGKTTLIKKLLEESFKGQKLVLIENEFGEIGIDGGFLKDSGIQINEMNSGCICCSLVGDFNEALHEVVEKYNPDRVIIEPSGVGKLSDVSRAVGNANKTTPMVLGSAVAVVNAKKAKMYMKNFGEFFNDQIETAGTIILSRTQDMDEAKLEQVIALIREHNKDAVIITTPWDQLSGDTILSAMAHKSLAEQLMAEAKAAEADYEDECDDPDCECHHHHHHHHDHDECECGHDHEHHHHHDHECDDPDCECHHDHDHEHHHHDHEEHEHHHEHHHDHDHE